MRDRAGADCGGFGFSIFVIRHISTDGLIQVRDQRPLYLVSLIRLWARPDLGHVHGRDCA